MESIENTHKQIASFIILSAALAVPAHAANLSGTNELIADAALNMNTVRSHEVILFYGAPQLPPSDVITPEPIIHPPVISLYAAPQIPIKPINPANPQPFVPIFEPEPIVPQPSPALNESSLNINNANNSANIMTQEAINKMNKVDLTAGKNINIKADTNTNPNGFINTEYGSVRVIEPFAHFVFK